jgi:hypothetical protein
VKSVVDCFYKSPENAIMIVALIAKDLSQVAKDRIFHWALAGFLLIYLVAGLFFISSFLASGGYPFAEMASLLFSRISLLQGALLALVTPWITLRILDRDLSGESKPMGAGMMATPFQIILSKLVASTLCLVNMLILTLPVFCLVRLLGAVSFRQIVWILSETFLFLIFLAVIVFHLRLRFKSWLSCWILSYAALILSGFVWQKIWLSVSPESCTLLFCSLLLLLVVLLFPHGNRMLLYERN